MVDMNIDANDPLATAVAVADAVAEAAAAASSAPMPVSPTPNGAIPKPLPTGWVMKASRSNPGYFYYFYIPTGLASWHSPVVQDSNGNVLDPPGTDPSSTAEPISLPQQSTMSNPELDTEDAEDRSSKRRKPTATTDSSTEPNAAVPPKKVRVLHILKKHRGSRNPSSWRQPKVTATLEEAKEELQGLLEILVEEEKEATNLEELQATFSELARTESDCSSAKRGGDLGFFGRRKMQPPFEDASFALQIGELTKEIVETSSGVHLILRIG